MAVREFASILGIVAVIAFAGGSNGPSQNMSQPVETLRLGSRMADAALGRGGGKVCQQGSRCDVWTGCIAPSPPPGSTAKVLPQGRIYDRYLRDLQVFQACREMVLSVMKRQKSDVQLVGLGPDRATLEAESFEEAVRRLNGDFFWEPASASSNVISRFGDEARSVFGPIPDADCAQGAKTIPLEVEGNLVELKPNAGKTGHPLEFEHRDAAGKVVKWTKGIQKCDKPSLAGNVTYCGPSSRLKRVVKGSVEWLFLCRKSTTNLLVGSIPYWEQSNPKFALLGTIGFNSLTGEIVFFDGRKDRSEFDWSSPFVPPGGHSYSDRVGRASAEALYDQTFQVQCYACHDNKNPYVINPHAQQARVGYFGGKDDPRAVAFSLGDYLPETPRNERAPFRVIGSGYTSTHNVELGRAKTIRDPTGNCTACHTLTTQITGRRFAADAAAQEPWISKPTWAQALELREEKKKYAHVGIRRTDWALRSGAGKIHPWMVPGNGNELSALPPAISSADWRRLSNCLWDAGGAECDYRPLYTPCPAPGSKSQGDGSAPTDTSIAVFPLQLGESEATHVVRVRWRYLNGYGNVPQRDDVRFNVAVKSTAIPLSGEPPSAGDYPGLDETKGQDFAVTGGEVGNSGAIKLIQNISYFGHSRFTEPMPSTDLRDFRIDLPAKCNRRYLVRILPKRFCFDQSIMAYGTTDHLLYADALCD